MVISLGLSSICAQMYMLRRANNSLNLEQPRSLLEFILYIKGFLDYQYKGRV